MKLVKLSCAFILMLGVQSQAMAFDECDKYKTSYDRTYCMGKLFMESDKELNSVYKSLVASVNNKTKQGLVETQRSWIKYRDEVCQPESGTINVDCNYRVNKERTEYLRDRLRECKVGNCRADMITRSSWR